MGTPSNDEQWFHNWVQARGIGRSAVVLSREAEAGGTVKWGEKVPRRGR